MYQIERESDPRILRDLIKLMDAEIKRQRDVIRHIEAEKSKEAQKKFSIEESFAILKKRYFGKSSERSAKLRERDRLNDDPELLVHSQNLLPPPTKKASRDLDIEEVVHEASAAELKSMSADLGLLNASAEQWEEVPGLFDKSTEITVVERQYKKILHKRKKYRLKKAFAIEEKEVLMSAPPAVKLVPGGSYSIEFAVSVVIDKYLNHIPLERQCRSMASLGLGGMSTQVLYNVTRLAGEHLQVLAGKIKNEVLSRRLVHSDETPWPINNSKDSDGYMWIIANQMGSYYRFEPTRSGKVVKETLGDYVGTIMSDAYAGYYQFRDDKDKRLALCHAHARRNFWDIKDTNPKAQEILDLWEELFKLERLARDFVELKSIRDNQSRLIILKMHQWLMTEVHQARSESQMLKAIQYCINHWKELTKFLDDPIIPLTNNEAERTIRQAVMGRKNFYGSRSIDGADLAATMYTIIESCKKVELDPREYLLKTIKNSASGLEAETPFEMAKRLRQ
jgi:transposase